MICGKSLRTKHIRQSKRAEITAMYGNVATATNLLWGEINILKGNKTETKPNTNTRG